MEQKIERVEAFQNRAIGVLVVAQFIGFGGMISAIVLALKAWLR